MKMKILLLGEFSAFFKNLEEGLQESGHKVFLVANGDGWKKIGEVKQDFFSQKNNKYLRKIETLFLQAQNIRNLVDFDCIQMVAPNIFGGLKYNYNYKIIKKLKEQNKKIFLSVAGDHHYIYKIAQKLRYSHLKKTTCTRRFNSKEYIKNNDKILEIVDGIIPTTYTYAEAYRNHSKVLNTIPFPFNSSNIKYQENILKNKLTIFHGLNREEAKGTKYIKEAMLRIKERYPNDVEIIIDGRMPLEKYLKVLQKTNIVIDQALSYGYGMNALYAMALGKVVFSGNEPETQEEFNRYDIPVINILPDPDDIYKKIEYFIQNKNEIEKVGFESRKFVEDFHDHKKVAQKYIDTWNS